MTILEFWLNVVLAAVVAVGIDSLTLDHGPVSVNWFIGVVVGLTVAWHCQRGRFKPEA